MVYSSPVVRLPSDETVTLPVEWDGENSAITLKLPEGISGPATVAFGIAAKLPKSKRDFLASIFPWLRFDSSGGIEKIRHEKSKVNFCIHYKLLILFSQSADPIRKAAFSYPPPKSPDPAAASPPGDKKDRKSPVLKVFIPNWGYFLVFKNFVAWSTRVCVKISYL